jgi:hypothetical protein
MMRIAPKDDARLNVSRAVDGLQEKELGIQKNSC